jgi:hypothetical protein
MPVPGEAPPLPAHPAPRPEHPRPDFRRDDWQNCNGWWDFAFDPEDRGLAEGWQRPDASFPERILVPFPWESLAAWGEAASADDARFSSPRAYREPVPEPGRPVVRGEWHDVRGRAARQRIGWYRRSVRLPEDWLRPDRRVFLTVGAADWRTTVFCNGVQVGSHEGGYGPFSAELTAALRPAGQDNVIVLRVEDGSDPDTPLGKQHWWYERCSGIWQTVYLEARPEGHLSHLRVLPDVPGRRVRVEVGVCPVAGNFEVRVTARSPRGEAFSASVVCPGCERRTVELPLGPHPDLWSPEDPQLYELTVEVAAPAAGPRATDTVFSYFGLREVGVGRLPGTDVPCVTCNGRPLYLRAALHQSFHPAGVYGYVDDRIIADDLRAARDAGLNALRIHIKVDDPRVYHWADRLGLCILYDLPGTGRQSPEARRNWEATLRAAIERDANHPSIVAWVLFNETWGLGEPSRYREDRDTQAWVAAMVDLTRRLDPSRLVEDNSPCNHDHVTTDVNSWHFYIHDYDRARRHVEEVVAAVRPGSPWNFVPGRTQGAEPLINSEYGGIGAGDGDRDVSWCLRYLTGLLRAQERITGFVYTELTDVEWEHNGLLRYDRVPKEFPYDLRDVLGADVLVADGPPARRAEPGASLPLALLVSVFSGRSDGTGTLRWSVEGTDTAGRHVHGAHGEAAAAWRAWRVTALEPPAVTLPAAPGLYQVRVALHDAAGLRVCGTVVDVWTAEAAAAGLPPDLAATGFAAVHRRGDYFVGEGAGEVTFSLPEAADALVLEAAAGVFQPPQTDARPTPSSLDVVVGGRALARLRLPDAPADARGVLSYLHGIPGAYGYLLRVPLPQAPGQRAVVLRAGAGGLALFGPRAGRYPL